MTDQKLETRFRELSFDERDQPVGVSPAMQWAVAEIDGLRKQLAATEKQLNDYRDAAEVEADLGDEARDEVSSLHEQLAAMANALRPFAALNSTKLSLSHKSVESIGAGWECVVSVIAGDVHKAAKLLAAYDERQKGDGK